MRRYLFLTIAALGLGTGAGSAQLSRSTPPSVKATPLQPDLVAVQEVIPGTIMEMYSTDDPCTPHSHTRTAYVRIKGRFGTAAPTQTAILYRDGQEIQSWTLTVPWGNQQITLGYFTWSFDHPCPSGGTSVSTTPPAPPHNYKLVVDPGGKLTETSENNNVVTFYVTPNLPFVRAP
jgi:hypothetical protein